jgi:hypothetical protein
MANAHLLRLKRRLGYPQAQKTAHEAAMKRGRAQASNTDEIRRQALQRQQDRMSARNSEREHAMNQLLSQAADTPEPPALSAMNLTIVSSLPRGGGAMLMAMLEAGGAVVLRDDDSTYGWSAVEQITTQPQVLEQARGKVVFVPSALLAYLPRLHFYTLIFVDRPIGEMVVSQRLQAATGEQTHELDDYEVARLQLKHRAGVMSALKSAPNFNILRVAFDDVMTEPLAQAIRIQEFIGDDILTNASAMSNAVIADSSRISVAKPIVPKELKTGIFAQSP